MVTAQCCGRTSGSLNPRPRAYYLFIYLPPAVLPSALPYRTASGWSCGAMSVSSSIGPPSALTWKRWSAGSHAPCWPRSTGSVVSALLQGPPTPSSGTSTRPQQRRVDPGAHSQTYTGSTAAQGMAGTCPAAAPHSAPGLPMLAPHAHPLVASEAWRVEPTRSSRGRRGCQRHRLVWRCSTTRPCCSTHSSL